MQSGERNKKCKECGVMESEGEDGKVWRCGQLSKGGYKKRNTQVLVYKDGGFNTLRFIWTIRPSHFFFC